MLMLAWDCRCVFNLQQLPASIWWLFLLLTYYFSSSLIKVCSKKLINSRWWMTSVGPEGSPWMKTAEEERYYFLSSLTLWVERVIEEQRGAALMDCHLRSSDNIAHMRGGRGGAGGGWLTAILALAQMGAPIPPWQMTWWEWGGGAEGIGPDRTSDGRTCITQETGSKISQQRPSRKFDITVQRSERRMRSGRSAEGRGHDVTA